MFCAAAPRPVFGADRTPLIFLGDKNYPPVTYLEGGVAKGIDVDLAGALAVPMQTPVRVDLMDWNLAQEKILNGEAAALTGLTITDERKKLFDFAEPTLTREFGFVVRGGEMTIHSVDDLKGKSVGVTAGGFPRKFMTTQPGVKLVLVDDYQDGFDRLKAGKIDALAADLWVAAYLIEKDGVHGITVVEKPFATAQEAIAVKKGNVALLQKINRGIAALKANGKLPEIESDWRPQEIVFASRGKIREMIVVGAGIFLAILFGVMGAWILTLKRQIRTRKKTERALRESEEKFSMAFKASPDGICITELETGRFLEVNDGYCKLFDYPREALLGRSPVELGILADADARKRFLEAVITEASVRDMDFATHRRDGQVRFIQASAERIKLGTKECIVSVIHDITNRKRAEELTQMQMQVLEMLSGGKSLREALDMLLRRLESQSPEMLCSILLLDPDGLHIRHGAAPSLPANYLQAIDGTAIGPGVGSCGMAAFARKAVFVADIENDPLWADYKKFALPHGLRACWSTPIFDESKNVLGTFAIYYRHTGLPGEWHLRLIAMATHTAAICLIKHRTEAERQQAVFREHQARAEYTLQLIASQEAERTRIARELHDGLGQNLLLIKNHALLARTDENPAAAARLEEISGLAAQAITEVRQISYDLHPYQLDHLGFTRAVAAMIDSAAEASGIVFQRKLDSVDNIFPTEAATNLYRIIQEAVNNILKHSRAKRASITLECDVREVQLRVEDDGCGFKTGNHGKGLGLKNIAERTRSLNGTWKVDSRPGHGTRIEVTIPIAAETA